MPKALADLKVKIFADGADKMGMVELAKDPVIKGFTTNPTLMRKAGITDYAAFAKDILAAITNKPISFEVFSDDLTEMERQARIINAWAPNVYVKIPIMNTQKKTTAPLIKKLAAGGVKLNITAILTMPQVIETAAALSPNVPAIVSVFAGRVADTGVDPIPLMKESKVALANYPKYELLWASTREFLNIYQAEAVGAEIITVPHDILKKAAMVGMDHHELSFQTVKMFYEDGQKVGYTLYES